MVFLSGFILSGAGVALLVRSLTSNGLAGFAAGVVFAFLPYRIDHYPHLQLQQTQCLPFAFWAFHRLLRSGRLTDGLLFGAFTAPGRCCRACTTDCFLFRTSPWCAVRFMWPVGRSTRPLAVALAAAAAVAVVAVLPVGLAYLGAHAVVGERSLGGSGEWQRDAAQLSGPAGIQPGVRRGAEPFAASERRLFPGFAAMALTLVAIGTAFARRRGSEKHPFVRARTARGVRSVARDQRHFLSHPVRIHAVPRPPRCGSDGRDRGILSGGAVWIRCSRVDAALRVAGWPLRPPAVMLVEYASKPLDLRQIPTSPPESYADAIKDNGDSPTPALFEFPATPVRRPDLHVLLDVSLAAPGQRL